MEEADKILLQTLHVKLMDSIMDYQGVSDRLFAAGLITWHVKERIDEKKGRDMIREILNILPRRGSLALDTFYQVLIDLQEYDAADMLRPDRASQRQSCSDHAAKGEPKTPQPAQSVLEEDELPEKWPDETHDPMRTKVTNVTDPAMKKLFERAKQGQSAYAMDKPGIFLLISNENFKEARANGEKYQDREGTDMDVLALSNLFSDLGFRVVKKINQTAKEMMETFQRQVTKVNPTDSCFACAVLTHGEKGVVIGTDGHKISLQDIKAVIVDRCPLLLGKPKLFFIQACQGAKFDRGGTVTDGGDAPAPCQPSSPDSDIALNEVVDQLAGRHSSDKTEMDAAPDQRTSSKQHVFVAMATVEDFVSWRNKEWGTWFVQAVVYIFSRFAHKYDVDKLMRRVNKLVGRAETKKGYKQVSTFSSSMSEDFYFFPGLSNSQPATFI